jgi:hypothetical protein
MKKRIKRLLKRLAWTAGVTLGVIALAIAGLRFFFPKDAVLALVVKRSAASGWPVEIGSASVNPFGRIHLADVNVALRPDSSSKPIPFFTLERATIRFRLLPLLRRKLAVSEVLLDKPRFRLGSDFLSGLRILAKTPKDSTKKPAPLPFEIGLLKLELSGFSLRTSLPDTSTVREIGIDGLNLSIEKLRIPQGFEKSPAGFKGTVHVVTKEGRLSVVTPWRRYLFDPGIDAEFKWGKKGAWTFNASSDLRSTGPERESLAGLRMAADGIGLGDSIKVGRIDVTVGRQKALSLHGWFSAADTIPRFDCEIDGKPVSMEPLAALFLRYLPDSMSAALRPFSIKGTVTPLSGCVSGTPKSFRFDLASAVSDAQLDSPEPAVRAERIRIDLSVQGTGSPKGLKSGTAAGSVEIPLVRAALNDTESVNIGRTSMQWSAVLNPAGLPSHGELSGSVMECLGGKAGWNAAWDLTISDRTVIEDFSAKAEARVDGVDLAALPAGAHPLSGRIFAGLNLDAENARSILVRGFGEIPAAVLTIEGKSDTLPRIRADMEMNVSADSGFKKWSVFGGTFRVSDLFRAAFTGIVLPFESAFDFQIRDGVFDNKAAVKYIPRQLLETMAGIQAGGRETLEAWIRSKPDDGTAVVALEGGLRLENGSIVLPSQSLIIDGVNGAFDFNGSTERVSGNSSVRIGRIVSAALRPEPVTDGSVDFRWNFWTSGKFGISDGRFSVPGLALNGSFDATGDSLETVPVIGGHAEFQFSSRDTVNLTPLLAARGGIRGSIRVESIAPERRQFRIDGEAEADSFTVYSKPAIEVRNIEGVLPFSLIVDPVRGGLAPSDSQKPVDWLAYGNQQDWYKAFLPSVSRIRIESVKILDYTLKAFRIDIAVQNGLVQVPRFQGMLLGGNVGGSFWLDLADGKPASMSYFIKADAARLNSAILIKASVPDEDTELDATMEFHGRGLDPKTLMDLDGALHITKIGPQFAGTLLEGIDPQGTDRSIRMTKRLFNFWYKPKLFSFELRHGYVYPSLVLTQPWFTPLRIPERVEFGRLPLEFFLKNPAALAAQ